MQGFVLMGRYPAISVGIAKAKAGAYKSPKDLKGMKIGVSAPGSSTNRMVLAPAREGWVEARRCFDHRRRQRRRARLPRSSIGQLDAMSNVDPVMTMLESSGAS